MRRFLDWTAAQAAGGQQISAPNSRQNSHFLSQGQSNQAATTTTMLHQAQSSNPAKDLELQHLTKLLHEIKYYQASSSPLPSAAGSQNQREFVEKVHRTLPLFLNVFGNGLSTPASGAPIQMVAGSCQSSIDLLDTPRSGSSSASKPNSPLPPALSADQQHPIPSMDKFPDLLPFAFTIARLFVSEVRQRASNKHAEDASLAILQFLNNKPPSVLSSPKQTTSETGNLEATSNLLPAQGWNLLLSLNTLAYSQNSQIIKLLCEASLPSTLIKCLYLFFDLAATPQSTTTPSTTDKDSASEDDNRANDKQSNEVDGLAFAREITSGPFIKAFNQLLIQLCSNQAAIDELIKKDDLRLLIGIASSQCLSHNKPWRKTAFQTLLAISKNMRDNFMYLQQNICIQIYVENMHRINSLGLATTEEFIDMINTLLQFLYNLDVNNRNQPNCVAPIIEQFKVSRIVDLIEELIIKIDETIMQESQASCISPTGDAPNGGGCESIHNVPMSQQPSVSSEFGVAIDDYRRYGRRLIQSLTFMAKINVCQDSMSSTMTLKPLATSRFEMLEQFRMPKPSARNCILNFEALRLLKMSWTKCLDSYLIEAILDTTISLFNDDKYNYFIFESQQLLVYYMTSYNFKLFPFRVKQKLFKFLEFIIIETNYIPCLELGTLGTIIKNQASSNVDLILGLRTLIACLGFNSRFSDIFRDIGLLEVVVDLLIQTMQQDKLSQDSAKLEVLYLLLEASQYLLAGPNNLNCTQFNESGAARYVFNCLSKPEFFHLFIPSHSSSSDESAPPGPNSKNNTPLSAQAKSGHLSTGVSRHRWHDSTNSNLAYNKPSMKQLQKVAFTIIRQLILSTAGDEHLANLLGLLARNLEDLQSLGLSAEMLSVHNDSSSETDQTNKSHNKLMNFNLLLSQEVNLKISIFKSLMIVLKDSHRCRTLFRKTGGFIYIVSSLVTLEKSLCAYQLPPKDEVESHERWRYVNNRRIWRLIKNSLMTIVVALRFEPANLRAFSENVIVKFTEALRRLGCFKYDQRMIPSSSDTSDGCTTDNFKTYKSIFLAPPTRDLSTMCNDNIKSNEACCQLLKFLYDMSLDMGDGTMELELQLDKHAQLNSIQSHHPCSQDTKSMSFDQSFSVMSNNKESGIFKRRAQLNMAPKRPPSLDLNSSTSVDPAILTFPCIIVAILDLIPSCPNEDLMNFTCIVIKSLFKHERNQQLLCEAGMISKLLSPNWLNSITNKNHFLHESIGFMMEKLTKQSITARELRMVLRLGNPLKCKNLDEIEVTESCDETRQKLIESNANKELQSSTISAPIKEKIETDRIATLVTMMSDDRSKTEPPFIEFDMSTDGFFSIFMPSIAPVNAKSLPPNTSSFLNSTLDVHTNEKNGILGGIGGSERQFPPVSGLTFSTWVCVEKFPSRSSDVAHNLRLLTIYRGSAATGKEYSCFRIQVSALDRALTISTQETLLFDNENRTDAHQDPDCNVRIWTPELLLEGKWHLIAVTMNRSLVKQSTINVYVDGSLVHSQRICYISSYVGSVNSGPLGNTNARNVNCSAAAYVNAFIGSLPQLRFRLRTRWKQGPCHLIEEPLSANFIGVIYALGPNFIGNFQNPHKLHEIAKTRGLQQNQFDLRYHQSMSGSETPAHKSLAHQQSMAVTSSSRQQTPTHAPLTRVSSSTSGTQSGAGSQQHSPNSQNQYNLAEDRVIISIDARATSLMTLSRMRRIYTRFDCRQVSRVLGLTMHENSTPILLLHNTGLHLNGTSRGVGAVTIGHNHVRCFVPSPTQQTLSHVGGCYILLGLIAQAQTNESFDTSLNALVRALKHNNNLQAQMDQINGYQILSLIYWKKKHLLSSNTLKSTFALITDCSRTYVSGREQQASLRAIQQVGALRDLVCECFDLWLQTDMIDLVLEFIYELINSSASCVPVIDQANNRADLTTAITSHNNSARIKNLKCLRDMDLLPRMLRLLPQYDSQQVDSLVLESGCMQFLDNNNGFHHEPARAFNTKAIYLIKQTVFELLNRTPRQSDILYFGQFLASLLPSKIKERPMETVKLRNILLKSLLQMMTKNNQSEVNGAIQTELVRILGFDWFMLFISGSHLNTETLTLGLFNLMIILSNDDLYQSFRSKSNSNGCWLKEPTFPSMDGKFNIQVLGINVGVFFGLGGKRKSIKQEVLEAPNFFLLCHCLRNLVDSPRTYLMIFQTMMSRMCKLDASVMDTIESFDKLNLDILCDSLMGDTHHKRRQTLSSIQFRCHELVVCIVYMLCEIMWQAGEDKAQSNENNSSSPVKNEKQNPERQYYHYPTEVIKFLMYLYNNNQEFQRYCRTSDDLIDALSACLMVPEPASEDSCSDKKVIRSLSLHPALKETLELSRLIILDTMTDPTSFSEVNATTGNHSQLRAFERFLDNWASCKDAQGELIDMLLRQVLLMIDSTARHNSIKTISSSDNVVQFQLLLINSISISQIVTDKIWLKELYSDNWSRVLDIIDHQLCLAEQVFKFNELLPVHSPPHAFSIQRVLNRVILFALSRPMRHMSDKMLMLDLLKKIYDNRTIIILNHMHSPQSAEFFVCLAFCLMNIIEDNMIENNTSGQPQSLTPSTSNDQPASLIERQYGHPSLSSTNPNSNGPSSTSLMLISLARKIWDAVYQSKKGILSEAFDVSLSLPAFTLDTSLDLLQLKPDIQDTCQRYWCAFVELEQRPKKRLPARGAQTETSGSGNAASAAVNLLSGRLTRVVNAASFVSRVVGATAGTMASNVNLVGEKLTQNRTNRRDSSRDSSQQQGQQQPQPSQTQTQQPSQQQQSGSGSQGSQIGAQSISNDLDLFKCPALSKRELEEASQVHISIIEDYIESQMSQKNHKLALHKYLCDEWFDLEDENLLRERAIFGPDYGSQLDKWCLDLTEGPRRMRKKMVNNTRQFYDHYPYQPEQYNPDNKSLRYRPPMSYDSHLYYMKTLELSDHLLEWQEVEPATCIRQSATPTEQQQPSPKGGDELLQKPVSPAISVGPVATRNKLEKQAADDQSSIESLVPTTVASIRLSPPQIKQDASGERGSSLDAPPGSPQPPSSDAGDLNDDGDSSSFVDFSPEIEAETNSAREQSESIDSLSVLRLLEKNERISHMFRCSRVQGLDTFEGLMLFGREHFYLIDGFTLLKTREIKDIDTLPPGGHDPIIPNSTPNTRGHTKKTWAKFSFDSVVEVHKRRYLLQPIALEVFSSDGRNTLIAFPRNIRNKVYSRLMTVSTQLTNNAHESLAGQKSNVSVEGGSGLLSNLIGETSVTQRWVRGELSNFQYLMNLNTIAGRSYNDLMQYPIFPWILADYSSHSLDLTKPSTFRDLSRPVGAQTSERLEQFKRRYADWDDTETPPYHYGTFYSSAMIVASYMVRMEPFTQHFLRLQGGHFDLADRMFHSMQDSWLSASKHNMADIKELVPEFFYLPEFLMNRNKYDLGIKQNGKKLDDVILPPWAKSDAREFIRLHRCALESDYVSAHLHEWIDLIFGYKQQGPAAVEAVNVFHHLFYEGNVDIYNTDIDPIKKNAVIGFINNFGQVPKQLFKKPHPARKVTPSSSSSTPAPSMPLTPILPSISSASAGFGSSAAQRILTKCPQLLRQSNASYKDLRGPVGQIVQIDKSLVAVEQNKLLIPPEYCRYVAWGHADRSLRLGLYESEKPIFVWEGSDIMSLPHEVLACAIPNSRTMITAGTESLITVWKIEKMKSFSPVLNLYGHVEPVTCLAASQSYSVLVSGSRDRTAIIWDLNRFTFVRQLGGGPPEQLVHQGPVSAIAINDSTGDIATCASSRLYLWTINGELLAQVDSLGVSIQQSVGGSMGVGGGNLGQLHILSVCFSQFYEWDSDEVILTGASDGSVAIWSMRYAQVPMSKSELDAREKLTAQESVKSIEEEQKVQAESSSKLEGSDKKTSLDRTEEVKTEELDSEKKVQSSEPISIVGGRRERTNTMNSEWVRLSASSSSTIDTISQLRATPPRESAIGDEFATGSVDSFAAEAAYLMNRERTTTPQEGDESDDRRLMTSTPVADLCLEPPTTPLSESNGEETARLAASSAGNLLNNDSSLGNLSNTNFDDLDGSSMSKANLLVTPNDPSLIKFSKSDTSLLDSFVILGDTNCSSNQQLGSQQHQSQTSGNNHQASGSQSSGDRVRPQSSAGAHPPRRSANRPSGLRGQQPTMSATSNSRHQDVNRLMPNHRWKRELYLRAILPRRNNKAPIAAVTSLTISKDHKTVFVGDASGKISSWTTA